MNPNVTAPLVTGLEAALEVARDETAEVTEAARPRGAATS